MQDYRGYVQADAYPGYDALFEDGNRKLIGVAGWAHSWGIFMMAQTLDVGRAPVVLAYVGLLYKVEREARDRKLNVGDRLTLRHAKSRPILNDIKVYLEAERPKLLPNPIGEAIDYALRNGQALLHHRREGDLEIDKPRSLRPIVVGRNNWMLYANDEGERTGEG